MSEPSANPPDAGLVARLRAAGCVFAQEEAALLSAVPAGQRAAALARRVAGEPLEHVLGWAEIAGVRIAVAPGVFIPRRRTELLIDHAAHHLTGSGVLLDLCCGSGAVARVLAERRRPARVHASDIDPVAVAVARENLAGWGTVSRADVVDGVPVDLRGRVSVLTANVPYVPSGEVALLPREARLYEPAHTYDGGPDGLRLLRRVLLAAREWLAPAGVTLSEVAVHQGEAALAAARAAGLTARLDVAQESGTAVLSARREHAAGRRRRD